MRIARTPGYNALVALSLAFACPSCGSAVEGAVGPTTAEMACPSCKAVTPLPEAPALCASGASRVCPVCGSTDIYQQRDFNRKLGLGLAAVGLLTGPFTQWISTMAFVGLDAALYLLVPPVAICYACEGQQRGFDRAHGPAKFEIAIHDVYKFGRRFPPRRAQAVAGPLARRLLQEGKVPSP